MTRACCEEPDLRAARPDGEIVIALAGNPNVGKSTLFNALTGLGVSTAHYPGTTREVYTGSARAGEARIGVIDLPGTYGLTGPGEDEQVTRRAIADMEPDVIAVVVDPLNLGRTLRLALEVLDGGFRVVVALNLADEAERAGITVDTASIAEALGVPVVTTVGVRGTGVSDLVDEAFRALSQELPAPVPYSADFEALLLPLVRACGGETAETDGAAARRCALARLDPNAAESEPSGSVVPRVAEEVRSAMRSHFGEAAQLRLSRERHDLSERIADAALATTGKQSRRFPRDLWSLTTWPWTGVPLVLLVGAAIFGFLFFVGDRLATLFSTFWETYASPFIESIITAIAGTGTLADVLLWGFDAGIEASLAIGIPYILTFYFLLGLLEDTGYLNSLAFLTDRVMHRLGLHGRAVVPLVAAAGCNVPALIAANQLPTKRERLIASTLVVFIPCSARTAVILGAVGHYVGWQPALLVLGIVFAVWLGIGLTLQRMLPGQSEGLVMEMFPFRRPSLRRVGSKAWAQFREFLFIATPIVVAGSLVLGALYETGWLAEMSRPLEPFITGWLGLPAVAGLTLMVGMLRKELALQLLIALAVATAGIAGAELTQLMSATDIAVYALVNALALPCISSVAVFWRRQGAARTLAVVGASVAIALVVGGIAARVLPLLGMG